MCFAERLIGILLEAGFDAGEAARAFRLLFTYTFGFAGVSPSATDQTRGQALRAAAALRQTSSQISPQPPRSGPTPWPAPTSSPTGSTGSSTGSKPARKPEPVQDFRRVLKQKELCRFRVPACPGRTVVAS